MSQQVLSLTASALATLAWLWQAARQGWQRSRAALARPDAETMDLLVELAQRRADLRHWLLVVASESPRLRRVLWARGAEELREEESAPEVARALKALSQPEILHAVVEALFRRQGLEPLAPAHRTGRGARVRLAELGECWHPAALCAA